eukprot:2356139-Pleurochrysis_carterae.AAC.1
MDCAPADEVLPWRRRATRDAWVQPDDVGLEPLVPPKRTAWRLDRERLDKAISSSASILLDRLLDVVSLGPPRHGGLRLARALGKPRFRRLWHRSGLRIRVGWSHLMRSRWERYTQSVIVLRLVPLALRLGVERPESDGREAP